MELKELLASLGAASCITSAGKASQLALDAVRKFAPNAHRDRLGSIIAPVREEKPNKPHILLDAHIDEIGFVVTAIDENGFLHVGKVGGTDMRILLGHEVTVFGKKELFGVFCCRPPHLSSSEDYKKVPSIDELAIDIGFSHDDACDLVSPGDYITLRATPAELCGETFCSKALDNRSGVAAVLRCLEICGERADCSLTAVFSLSEELGLRGAATAAFSVAPTHALVVDVSYGMTPDAPREKCGEMGKGPMIGISPVLSREVTATLISIARAKSIPFQTEVMGGETGTNADAVSVSRVGVATGLLSIPLRYMHTAVECVKLEDVEKTARLMAAAVLEIGGERNA
jgi:endoglucanase